MKIKISLPPIQVIPQDFKTPWEEIKQKSYNWHWIGGTVIRIILAYLFFTKADFPIEQALVMSFVVNSVIWFAKEFVWYTAFTFEKHFAFLRWMRKFKIFQWSKPDWKDWRFSVYGSLPFTALIYLFTKKNE